MTEEPTDFIEQKAFDLTTAVNDYLITVSHDDMRPAAYTELARAAGRIMRFLIDADQTEEHFADVLTEAGAEAFGHLAMQAVGDWSGDRGNAKRFFLDVAEVLGPDHVEAFRVAGVFMAKTEQF